MNPKGWRNIKMNPKGWRNIIMEWFYIITPAFGVHICTPCTHGLDSVEADIRIGNSSLAMMR